MQKTHLQESGISKFPGGHAPLERKALWAFQNNTLCYAELPTYAKIY